jgi:PIN domain nuclease of toxin-antitoxin system
MKYLLDTHTLLWWLDDNPTLSRKARQVISSEKNIICVSAVNAWEIAIKKSLGKLEAPDNLEEVIELNNFIHLPISIAHALDIGKLPNHHDDPFDRLLIAQAKLEKLTLITRDANIIKYDIAVVEA